MGGWRLVVPRDGDQGKGGQLQRLGDRQPPLPRSACLGRRWAGGECEAPKVPGESGLGDLCFERGHLLPTKSPAGWGRWFGLWALGARRAKSRGQGPP